MVLAELSDGDLDLLGEMAVLRESGFNEEQTATMMGDRYKLAMAAVTHFQEAYQEALSVL